MVGKVNPGGPKDDKCVVCVAVGSKSPHYANPVDNEFGPNHYQMPGGEVQTLPRHAPLCGQHAKYTF
ncbi:MAG: hypothetical protein ABIJ92_04815 [Candidatus Aenigmatarchaeota archaeon]